MDDCEARYLIDQYNKLLSYAQTEYQVAATYLAVATAVLALTFSTGSIAGFIKPGDPTVGPYAILAVVLCGCLLYFRYRQRWRVTTNMKEGRQKIFLLDQYRSKNKWLPNSITLKVLWEGSLEDLRKPLAKKPR